MAKWKAGDRVRVAKRDTTKEDRATNSYYDHMAGLTGTITNVYNKDEIAVRIDPDVFPPIVETTHKESVKRMRVKFLDSLSEEQKRKLSKEERQFDANYVLLVHSEDLEKGPPAQKVKVVEAEEEDLEDFDPTSVKQGVLYDDPNVTPSAPAKRKSLSEIRAAEERELKRRRN